MALKGYVLARDDDSVNSNKLFGDSNLSAYTIKIPLSGTDATTHNFAFQLGTKTIFQIIGDGNGAGDASISTAYIHLPTQGTATGVTQTYDSVPLRLDGSAWNGSAAEIHGIRIYVDPVAAGPSPFGPLTFGTSGQTTTDFFGIRHNGNGSVQLNSLVTNGGGAAYDIGAMNNLTSGTLVKFTDNIGAGGTELARIDYDGSAIFKELTLTGDASNINSALNTGSFNLKLQVGGTDSTSHSLILTLGSKSAFYVLGEGNGGGDVNATSIEAILPITGTASALITEFNSVPLDFFTSAWDVDGAVEQGAHWRIIAIPTSGNNVVSRLSFRYNLAPAGFAEQCYFDNTGVFWGSGVTLNGNGTQNIQLSSTAGVARAMHFDIPVGAGGAADAALDFQFKIDGTMEAGLLAETNGSGGYRQPVWKIPYVTANYNADWSGFTAPAPASLTNGSTVLAYNSNGAGAHRLYLYSNSAWKYVGLS